MNWTMALLRCCQARIIMMCSSTPLAAFRGQILHGKRIKDTALMRNLRVLGQNFVPNLLFLVPQFPIALTHLQ
jgi:hypothetical protein